MRIEILGESHPDKDAEPGQAYWTKLTDKSKGYVRKRVLWLSCHKCGEVGLLSDHTITEHEDGTITVEPSIVCPNDKCDAHYFIRNNEIQ